jgi:thymidylate synthase (FAD)
MAVNKNTVELLGYYGNDEIIACSAWTSTSRDLTEDKRSRIPKLINMLWRDGHETPFEKATVHFLVDCDIASHIHLLKHRIASINAESARYKELKEDKMLLPDDWRQVTSLNGKVIKFFDVDVDVYGKHWDDILKEYSDFGNELYHRALNDLESPLGRKRAKESARFFKTYNSQIQADVSFNLRSFANFQKLRNSEHAQKEIREIAQQMLELVKNIEGNPFKYTLEAWENQGLVK